MTASNHRSESLFPPAGTNSMYDTSVFDLAKVCLSVIYVSIIFMQIPLFGTKC